MKPKYPIVRVTWIDSMVANARWMGGVDERDLINEDLPVCESVGFLLRHDEQQVMLAQSVQQGMSSDYIKIPTFAVRSIWYLRKDKEQ